MAVANNSGYLWPLINVYFIDNVEVIFLFGIGFNCISSKNIRIDLFVIERELQIHIV